jgi:hypothetical protein
MKDYLVEAVFIVMMILLFMAAYAVTHRGAI